MGIDISSVAPELLAYSALLCGLLILFAQWPLPKRRLSIAALVLVGIALALSVFQEAMAHRFGWTSIAVGWFFTTLFLVPGGILGGRALSVLQRRGVKRWLATAFASLIAVLTTWIVPPIIIVAMIMTTGFPPLD
jgi:prolipoprotein diacylglyceryltransferase